jgi:hypothetical protein
VFRDYHDHTQRKDRFANEIVIIPPVLNNRSLSIGFRVRMFRTCIIGTFNYGIELLYGSIKKVQPLQLLINKALRAVLNCNRSTSRVAMSLEAGSISTRATARVYSIAAQ